MPRIKKQTPKKPKAKAETATPEATAAAAPKSKTPTRTPMAKWQVAQVYRAYLSRPGPQNLGTVEWPKAKKGCLKGVKILSTGVFDTIEREDLVALLTGCGAHFYSGMSKNLHYLLVGRDAGPVKLQEAEANNIPQLSEAEFHAWIKEKIDSYVPTADDDADVKSKPAKGKAVPKARRPKPETKPRKAPAERKPLPKVPEYDSDQSSESDEDVSDDEKLSEDEDELSAPPPNKKAATKATAMKRGRPAGRGKAVVKAESNGIKSESDENTDKVAAAVPQLTKKKAAPKAPAAKRGRPARRGVAEIRENGIKSESVESDEDNGGDEPEAAKAAPAKSLAGKSAGGIASATGKRGRPAGRGKAAVKKEETAAEAEVIAMDGSDTGEPANPAPKKAAAAKRKR